MRFRAEIDVEVEAHSQSEAESILEYIAHRVPVDHSAEVVTFEVATVTEKRPVEDPGEQPVIDLDTEVVIHEHRSPYED